MTRRHPPAPTLFALDGPLAGARISIPDEGLWIGRDTIPALGRDRAVSGRHALIRWTGDGRLMIEDVGSRNGTRVNGSELSRPAVVGAGDRIEIGAVTYELRIPASEGAGVGYQGPTADREGVAIDGGLNASTGGVGAGRDIHGNIHTGDYYESYLTYDPTGLSDVSGFPRLLTVVGVLIGLAGFAFFAYPIVMGLVAGAEIAAAHAACDQQFARMSQANFDCHFNVGSGITFAIAPWMPIGAGLLFAAMVLTVVARILHRKEEPRAGRRRA